MEMMCSKEEYEEQVSHIKPKPKVKPITESNFPTEEHLNKLREIVKQAEQEAKIKNKKNLETKSKKPQPKKLKPIPHLTKSRKQIQPPQIQPQQQTPQQQNLEQQNLEQQTNLQKQEIDDTASEKSVNIHFPPKSISENPKQELSKQQEKTIIFAKPVEIPIQVPKIYPEMGIVNTNTEPIYHSTTYIPPQQTTQVYDQTQHTQQMQEFYYNDFKPSAPPPPEEFIVKENYEEKETPIDIEKNTQVKEAKQDKKKSKKIRMENMMNQIEYYINTKIDDKIEDKINSNLKSNVRIYINDFLQEEEEIAKKEAELKKIEEEETKRRKELQKIHDEQVKQQKIKEQQIKQQQIKEQQKKLEEKKRQEQEEKERQQFNELMEDYQSISNISLFSIQAKDRDPIIKFSKNTMKLDLYKYPELAGKVIHAMTAPLPPNWESYEDEDGHPYYYCSELNISQYEHPLDRYYKKYLRKEKHKLKKEESSSCTVS